MVILKLKRIIIAAVSANRIIGKNNRIPWYSKEELRHFKSITQGSPILMGRKTFESLSAPLPDRLNIIISKNELKLNQSAQTLTFRCVKDAYQYLRKNGYATVFICGGGQIYSNTIKHADEMIISHMKISVEGEVPFPRINNEIWKVNKQKDYDDFILKYYVRKK